MGTNYYHRTEICECCGRYDERHICKSMISFQGYRPSEFDEDTLTIVSWADWKKVLREGGEVWDEYGVRWDTAEFIREVEETPIALRRRQWEWMRDHAVERVGYSDPFAHDWLDADDFSFCDLEFS